MPTLAEPETETPDVIVSDTDTPENTEPATEPTTEGDRQGDDSGNAEGDQAESTFRRNNGARAA
ncbi:hypothetical protein ACFYXL_05800 [Streptomyces tsukubensis]|uniref:hypothetical protein n=1 Tax=Streptomyces tsukubensis TaxID=83656 RepID=UPI0036982B4A